MVTPGAHGGVSKAFVWSGTDGSAGRPAEALARVGCGADVPGCPGGSHQLHIDALIALVCARVLAAMDGPSGGLAGGAGRIRLGGPSPASWVTLRAPEVVL